MKNLINIIEKLKIDSKSKISDDKSILDQNINSIDELHDVIEQYFKVSDPNTTISKVDQLNRIWKFSSAIRINVGANFYVTLYKDPKNPNLRTHKLQFGEYHEYFLMQLLVYSGDKPQPCRIHGGSTYNEFKKGGNLLKFIQTIIKYTKENHPVDKDPNLLEIFKEL